MSITTRRPAAAARIRIQAILGALAAAGCPGAVVPQVLERTEHRALRRPREIYAAGPAIYPLGPLGWLWDSTTSRTTRPAGLTVEGGILVCLAGADSDGHHGRWRPAHAHPAATTTADLQSIEERLARLATAHGVTVPAGAHDGPDGDAAPQWMG